MAKKSTIPSWAVRTTKATRTLFEKLRKWTKGFGKKKVNAPNDEPSLDEDSSFINYSKRINQLDNIMVNLGLQEHLSASQEYLYEMGRRDGALGIKLRHLGDMALAIARDTFGHILVILKGKFAGLEAELAAARVQREKSNDLYDREQDYYKYVTYQYRFFPRNYSFLLFILYLTIALALILADMPLALNLIQEGFNLQGGGEGFTYPELFENGKFWSIIAANWETTFTAVGIALCTVYIKIYYDEFVGTPYANRLMTFERFLKENGFSDPATIVKKVNSEHRTKVLIKTVLLLVTLSAIVTIALFRYHTIAKGNPDFQNSYCMWAFIGIAILFPIIGGICLSYALNNIQNITWLWAARRNYKKNNNERKQHGEAISEMEKNYNNLKAAIDRFDDAQALEEYKQHLTAFYERGHAIGGMQPDKYMKGQDFFTKVLEWRNLAVSRRINVHINNVN